MKVKAANDIAAINQLHDLAKRRNINIKRFRLDDVRGGVVATAIEFYQH